MACGIPFRLCFYFLFIVLSVTKSLQVASNAKGRKSCSCYDRCQKNFTVDSINDDQIKEACQRGCRFYSLLFHASHGSSLRRNVSHAKEGCTISCHKSYISPLVTSACKFGCSSVEIYDSCDVMEHQLPQLTYALIVDESDVLIHPGDPDPDDVLIDPGLRKQIEKTLETLLDTKPKLPEIHFRNLPIINKETTAQHPHTTFKCPKFYGFGSKLEFQNGKITTSDLMFLFSLSVFAMICFIVSRNLEKQRKLWKQFLMNLLPNRPTLMKMKENLTKDEPLIQNDYLKKTDTKEFVNEADMTESIDSKFDGLTLVFYDDIDDEYGNCNDMKPNRGHEKALLVNLGLANDKHSLVDKLRVVDVSNRPLPRP